MYFYGCREYVKSPYSSYNYEKKTHFQLNNDVLTKTFSKITRVLKYNGNNYNFY